MNFSTTTVIGAYCSRSRHGASILDSFITIIFNYWYFIVTIIIVSGRL